MTIEALVLVLISAWLHAWWNMFLKAAEDKIAFTWLSLIISLLILSPFFIYLIFRIEIPPISWSCASLGGFFIALYYLALGAGYEESDLSFIYPIARGLAPALVILWAFLFIRERVYLLGAFGISLVILGIYFIHLPAFAWSNLLQPFRAVGEKATRLALLTGLFISFYSVIDKIGVTYVNPLAYIWLEFLMITIFLTFYLAFGNKLKAARREWNQGKKNILIVGFLNPFSYWLVLYALTLSKVSYIVALRGLSILFATWLGTRWLSEERASVKLLGSIIMAAGVALISLAK